MLGLVLFNIFIKDPEWESKWHINRNFNWHQIYRITKCADFLLEEKENWPKYNKYLNMIRKKNETFLSIIRHKNM